VLRLEQARAPNAADGIDLGSCQKGKYPGKVSPWENSVG